MSNSVVNIILFLVFFLAISSLIHEDRLNPITKKGDTWQKTWFSIDHIDSVGYNNVYYKKASIYVRNESEGWHYVDTLAKNQTIDMYLLKILTLPKDPWMEQKSKLEYQYVRIKYEY